MFPRLRPGPAAVGATALASAAVAVGGLIVAASVSSSPAPPETLPRAAVVSAAAPTTPDPSLPAQPPETTRETSEAPATAEPAPARQDGPILVVGDSISVGSAAAIRAVLGSDTTVDAEVGRQFSTAPARVAAWVSRNAGPIVVDLGANGTVSASDVESVLTSAGDRPVVLVGTCVPRVWQNSNNSILRAAAARHGSHVVFLDWASLVRSAGAGLLGADQIHPTPAGRTVLARAIHDALARAT